MQNLGVMHSLSQKGNERNMLGNIIYHNFSGIIYQHIWHEIIAMQPWLRRARRGNALEFNFHKFFTITFGDDRCADIARLCTHSSRALEGKVEMKMKVNVLERCT
jgi:hypothetical protein